VVVGGSKVDLCVCRGKAGGPLVLGIQGSKKGSGYGFILVASGFKMPCESIGYTTALTKQEKGVTSSRPATAGPRSTEKHGRMVVATRF
jgi:hypothetical protein